MCIRDRDILLALHIIIERAFRDAEFTGHVGQRRGVIAARTEGPRGFLDQHLALEIILLLSAEDRNFPGR